MKILLIGGPKFVGRALIDEALAAGHEITTFNRGKTNPKLYPAIEKLHGDRDGQLDALKGRTWDAVVDTSGYLPRVVHRSAELLCDAVGTYTSISSIPVLEPPWANANDSGARQTLDDETVEEITPEAYGALKALCEDRVQEIYGDRALIIRPGMIVGAYDDTYRFPYWVRRVAQGGDVLYPAGHTVQLIDVVDHARFVLHLLETGQLGVFHVTSPHRELTFLGTLGTIKEVSGSDATFVGVDDAFLTEHEVTPWSEFPFWVPGDADWSQVNTDRARAAGLTFRPLRETVRDTFDWLNDHEPPSPFPAGMSREREAALLQAYSER
jgi:2'-hydroxyisoflavone reductase